jgi:hypothetical protein
MAPTAFLTSFDEAAFTEHREMTRDGRLIAPDESLQVTDAHFLPADAGEELESRRIG